MPSDDPKRPPLPRSVLCTEAQLRSDRFLWWAEKLRPAWDERQIGEPTLMHRKLWEWIFIAESLHQLGVLAPGKRGLGFGVGKEPLAALFASHGCEIVATDLSPKAENAQRWMASHQHSAGLDALRAPALCDNATFDRQVTFRSADMNDLSPDLRDFDFTWSSCAFEHLGSITRGQRFILEQLHTLKPGGVGVHTTEFNVSSNLRTVDWDHTVLFRERDVRALAARLRSDGHEVELDLTRGEGPADLHVDQPPYGLPHLKLQLERYTATSLGLVVRRGQGSRQHLRMPSALRRSAGSALRFVDSRVQRVENKALRVVKRLRRLAGW